MATRGRLGWPKWLGLVSAPWFVTLRCMVQTKSVHSQKGSKDGLRILATRFRGHRLKVDRYDVWMPNLAPSEDLLKGFLEKAVKWSEFTRKYRKQICDSSFFDTANRTIKNHGQKFTLRLLQHLAEDGNVTLLCHCGEDEMHCHRHVLKKLIERA